ncbi:MAG: heat-inducible transcriptional repressor HrcA, partial [Acidobacteriota bacterium]
RFDSSAAVSPFATSTQKMLLNSMDLKSIDMTVPTDTLDERSREMLALLIRAHIAKGEPVGSRTISKLTREGLSPATVRNIIGDLEEAGYLEQPHTSAGRVPTDKGYRFYVDHILEQTRLSESDENTIQLGLFGDRWPTAEQLMSRASHLLSRYSDNVGIVVLPNLSHDVIKHLEFVRLSDEQILVITVSRTGIVQDRLIRVMESFTQDELDRTARYVNANFAGMTLLAIREELLKKMSEEKALYDRLLQNAILLCEQGLGDDNQSGQEVFVEGTSNIIAKSDFADTERMRQLFRIFEEKTKLVKLLNECVGPISTQQVGIRIGGENNLPGLHGCTVITSSYGYGDQVVGSLGVLGPVRMEYARTISVVNYVARILEQALSAIPETTRN